MGSSSAMAHLPLKSLCLLYAAQLVLTPSLGVSQELITQTRENPGELVVAEVNTTAITEADVQRELSRRFKSHQRTLSKQDLHLLKKRVIRSFVDRELLLQAARAKGISVPDEAVDSIIEKLSGKTTYRGEFGVPISLDKTNQSDVRQLVLEDLEIERYVFQHVFNSIRIQAADILDTYEQRSEQFRRPLEVRLQHILLKTENRDIDLVSQKAEEIRQRAQSGESFESLARRYSEAPTRAKGGNLGFLTKNQMIPEFAQVGFSLSDGQISDVTETKYGLHIIRAVERRGGEIPPFEDLADEIKAQLEKQEQTSLLLEHIKLLRSANKVIQYVN